MFCIDNSTTGSSVPIVISLKRERDDFYYHNITKKTKDNSEKSPFANCIIISEKVEKSLKRENGEEFIFIQNKKQKVTLSNHMQVEIEVSKKRKREIADEGDPLCCTPIDPALLAAYHLRVDHLLFLMSGAFDAAKSGRTDMKVWNQICFVVDDMVTTLQDDCATFDVRVSQIAQMAFVLCEHFEDLSNAIGDKVIWLNQPRT